MKAVFNQNKEINMKSALKINKAVDSSNKAINTEIEEVVENSIRELTDNEKSFIIINNLLSDDVTNKNQSLSIRGGLLIECAKLSLDAELGIYQCIVDNDNTKTISKNEIEKWIQSIYDKGLNSFYNKMDFKSFKKSDSIHYSHFESLKDIALAVNFFIGNYHNGSKKIAEIPFCKVGLMSNQTLPIIYNVENEGNFFEGNKIYMRLGFLNSLQNSVKFPIKDKVMSKENGFIESAGIYTGANMYKSFSVNQIINIANSIINFKEIDDGKKIDTQVQFQNHFDDVTKLINSPEISKNLVVMNNVGTPKLNNMLDVYISTALAKKEYKNILELIKQVAESSLENKEFLKHLHNNNFVFVAQSFTELSKIPTEINKIIGRKS